MFPQEELILMQLD